MDDLRLRFGSLDRLAAPDLWDDIERRAAALGSVEPGKVVRARRPVSTAAPSRRSPALVLAAALLLVALAAAAFAVGSGLVRQPTVLPPVAPTSPSPTPSPSTSTPTLVSNAAPSATPEPSRQVLEPRFVPAGSLVEERGGHAAVLLPDGRVLLAGGGGAHALHAENYLNSTEVWDPSSGTFTPSGTLGDYTVDLNRDGMHALVLPDGRVLVLPAGCFCRPMPAEPAEYWDPATGTVQRSATLTLARHLYTATLLADGRVLIAGGNPSLVDPSTATAELWDPVAETVLPSGPLSFPRYGASATLLQEGRVLIVGGKRRLANGAGDAEQPPETAELWDPATTSFTPVPSLEGVSGTALTLPDGRVAIFDETAARTWDPVADTLAEAGSLLEPRTGYTTTLLADGRVLIVGGAAYRGRDGLGGSLRTVEIWDPATRAFTSAGTTADARLGHSATALPDGRVLVTGGYVESEPFVLGTAELWEPGG